MSDDSELNPIVAKYLEEFLPEHFPSLSETRDHQVIDYHWTGIMGFTPSRNPIVGPVYVDTVRQKRQYILAGFSGHGVSRAGSWYVNRLFARRRCCIIDLYLSYSAEAVAHMLLAEIEGKQIPSFEWMPSHFLTQP